MNDLIRINYESENPTVSGREMHTALEITTPYHIWFPRMCEYGFKPGKDYGLVEQICPTNNPKNPTTIRADHKLTIPMAKELCMLQRSEMGKEFRQYFISIEEAWNTPDKIMERALQIAHRRALEAERQIFALAEENETLEIALNTSLKFFPVAKYNRTFKMGWNSEQCKAIGKRLTAFCRTRAIEVRSCETNDERFGTVNSYPITAWEAFLEEAM
jgi:phage anti-repressor protein